MKIYDALRYILSTRLARPTFCLHRLVLQLSRGAVLPTSGRMPVLLLTTTGRRSGEPRTQPLSYLREGDRYIVIASNTGLPRPPAWYLNLTANPDAAIQVGSRRLRVRAEVAGPDDQARLWASAKAADPLYAAYERRTTRDIPIVFLIPSGDAAWGLSAPARTDETGPVRRAAEQPTDATRLARQPTRAAERQVEALADREQGIAALAAGRAPGRPATCRTSGTPTCTARRRRRVRRATRAGRAR